jgi:hypothetical protein
MVPYSRRIRAITGVRSGDFRLSAHARPAGSPSLRQSRKLYAELISSDRQRKGTSLPVRVRPQTGRHAQIFRQRVSAIEL